MKLIKIVNMIFILQVTVTPGVMSIEKNSELTEEQYKLNVAGCGVSHTGQKHQFQNLKK